MPGGDAVPFIYSTFSLFGARFIIFGFVVGLGEETRRGLGALCPCDDDNTETDDSHNHAKDHEQCSLKGREEKEKKKIEIITRLPQNIMYATSSPDLLFTEELIYPNTVEGPEGLPADFEVEDARKDK